MQTPVILVTNDDGIMAPGIRHLIKYMLELGDVVVVAPDKPQSGMGHAVTIEKPLRLESIKIDGEYMEYSCSGTPVDCVKLAVNKVLHRKPDLLVSGINHGSNSSINVIYSGTMSAAIEGAMEGIPSIGFSLLDYRIDADFLPSKKFIQAISRNVLKNGLPLGTCLNVNIPAVPGNQIKGIRVSRQANANWQEEFDHRKDPRGRPYYWLAGRFQLHENGNETDEWALANNYISMVPVQFDFTAHNAIPTLKKWKYDV
ncbi:MAG TPA: 5'/3'-nucleotidase SurE [Bacteroidales bacterium]|nr:5'/3'-nucleotidase SurE [Bacteroidales bacterium]